jgi:SAM-dependent methyltransferase
MAYFDWHEQPGYYRDITRHFPPNAKLLDVGCGTGWLAEHFGDYTGIDGSPDAVAAAQAKGRSIVQGDVDQPLPFEDASFDGVVLKDLLEHVTDPVAIVRETHRVLKPGALVFASSPDAQRWVWDDYTHRRPFTRKAFRLLFADQGFTIEEAGYESVMPGTSIVSRRMPNHRRPTPLRWAAWLPFVRRNVWLVARR